MKIRVDVVVATTIGATLAMFLANKTPLGRYVS